MNRFMKWFRNVLNVTVLGSLMIYRKNVWWEFDHLKFRIGLTEKVSSILSSQVAMVMATL